MGEWQDRTVDEVEGTIEKAQEELREKRAADINELSFAVNEVKLASETLDNARKSIQHRLREYWLEGAMSPHASRRAEVTAALRMCGLKPPQYMAWTGEERAMWLADRLVAPTQPNPIAVQTPKLMLLITDRRADQDLLIFEVGDIVITAGRTLEGHVTLDVQRDNGEDEDCDNLLSFSMAPDAQPKSDAGRMYDVEINPDDRG